MGAPSVANLKSKWLDHLNSVWATEASEGIGTRIGISTLFGRLKANKEIFNAPPQQSLSNQGILNFLKGLHQF